jgi:mannose-6-phosphate isomerase-like protein (cupin superfamily)
VEETQMKQTKRPWGNFKTFIMNKKCTVKILEIKAKGRLSLQKHKKRKELWFFLNPATVQLGNKKIKVKKGSLIKIPKNKLHRIIADKCRVQVLEISIGKFEEKDEIRVEDKYGRK